MKKLTSILLALVLLCSCIPAFAVSDCSVSYKNGVLTYFCNVEAHEDYPGVYQVEVFLDGSPVQSSAGPSLEGRKSVNLTPGKHTVTFADLKNSQSVSFAVGSDGASICAHPSYKLTSFSTSTTYPYDANNPTVHTISTRKMGVYTCTQCDKTKEELISTTTSTESHKLSGVDDTNCDRCGAPINYEITTKVTKVELDKSGTVELAIGDSLLLGTTLTPSNGAIKLTWKSSSSKYASVDQNGLVTAKKAGTATITVTTANKKKDTVKIKVVDPNKVSSVTLYQGTEKLGSTLKLAKGASLRLTGAVSPTTADATFSWKSSKTSAVTVSGSGETGTITGKAVGTSTITVTAGGKKDTVKVTVYDPTIATAIALDKSGTYIMGIGEKLQLGTTLTPATAKTTLKWSSSKAKYASVDEDGTVTANAKGTATITVKTANGKKDTVKIKVVDPDTVAAIKLDKTGTQKLKVGSTLKLKPTYGPSTADAPSYVWKSSNTKYATVDENGVVTAVKSGKTVTITCAVEGNTKVKTTVKVKTTK